MERDHNKNRKIIFYIYYDDLSILGHYLHAIKMWESSGFNVVVYSLRDKSSYRSIFENRKKYIVHHLVSEPAWIKYFSILIYLMGKILLRFNIKNPLKEISKLVKMGYFVIYCFFKTQKEGRNIIIAADPPSLLAAALVCRKTKDACLYSVRELFLSHDINNSVDRLIKYIERKTNKNALFTIEFDNTRAELLRNDNQLNPKSILIVPNAPPGKVEVEKMRYFHDKFNINTEKKIALYTGGIAEYNFTYQILESTHNWPENIVLIMHCWGSRDEIERLKKYSEGLRGEIYFSTERVLFDDIQNIYRSCDIGFALYGDQDLNHKYAGLSSGKLFNFMKACVPVITNDTPACREAVQKTGSGICIKDVSEIPHAIEKILGNEAYYRMNCERTFSTFEFRKNYQTVIDAVMKHVNNQKE